MTKRFWAIFCVLASLVWLPFPAAWAGQDQWVLLRTTKGSILMRIYHSVLPYTAGNFLDLVERGFYNGLTFHRVEGWVVQGGDPNGNGTGNFVDPDTGRPRYIKLQTDSRLNHNQPGAVAMARSNNPNSASCQFYILKRASPQLNGQYSVFGRVIRGMGTVNQLQIGDRILSAQIVDPAEFLGGGGGGARTGGGSYSRSDQAVPGVAEPPAPPVTPPPTGDAGF